MKKYTILAALLIVGNSLFSQSRLSIKISSGFAFPVGVYANKSPESSVVLDPNFNNIRLGFAKAENGFAKTGYFYEAKLGYALFRHLTLKLKAGQLMNGVATTGLSEFLSEDGMYRQSLYHDDYKFTYILPGIGIGKIINQWKVDIALYIGAAVSKYPKFSSTLYYTSPPHVKWSTVGDTSDLNSLMYEGSIGISRTLSQNLLAGLNLSFNASNVDYIQTTENIPGSSPNPSFEDTLKMRTINFGPTFSYAF